MKRRSQFQVSIIGYHCNRVGRYLSSGATEYQIQFDRGLKARQREWAFNAPNSGYYDYLRRELAERICDRLDDINKNFPLALDIGCHRGHIYECINSRENLRGDGGVGGVRSIIQCDISPGIAAHAKSYQHISPDIGRALITVSKGMQCDEEYLPFNDKSFDLVTSSMYLHWVNNLPGVLKKINSILKPDGVFVGCMLGGNSLHELRHCLYLAEQERRGGMSPHISPLISASDVAGLMQAANFSLPTVDVDTIKIAYPNGMVLLEHLGYMGEASAATRTQFVGKDVLLAACALYNELYAESDGSIPATFQVIYMIGWAPHESQQKPCQRGSATVSIGDAFRKR